MTTLYCAECGDKFEPDDEHVKIDAEHRPDRRNKSMYVFCPACWADVTDDWHDPA